MQGAARAGVGAAGLALVGCGDDDDDEEVRTTVPAPAQAQAEPEATVAVQTAAPAAGIDAAELLSLTAPDDILLQALGTTDNVSQIVSSALARAALPLSAADREVAFTAWRTGVGERDSGESTVALADGFGENTWRLITKMEFFLQALSYPQVKKIIYTTAQADPTKAISDMQSLIAQGVDIIVPIADSGEALLPTAIEASERGALVAVATLGVGGTPGEDYLAFIVDDLCKLGSGFAEIALRERGNDINVVELGGTPGNLLSSAWQACAEPLLDEAGARLIGKADTNWTQEGTFQEMSAFLARESKIDAIFYEYADGFLGGVRAYEQANRELDSVLTLRTDEQGIILEWDRLRADNPKFQLFFATSATFQSRIALHTAMLAAGGNAVPAIVDVPFAMREVTTPDLYNPALPPDAPISSVVPPDVLQEMFA